MPSGMWVSSLATDRLIRVEAYDTEMERRPAGAAGEEGIGFSKPIVLKLPSRSEYVLMARLMVAQVGQTAGFGPEDIYDMKLAVTEAATNAIRHASVDHFEVEYRAHPGVVEITVVDTGGGFSVEDLAPDSDSEGGFGLAVIRSLADEVILDSTEGGTRLKIIRRASGSAGKQNG